METIKNKKPVTTKRVDITLKIENIELGRNKEAKETQNIKNNIDTPYNEDLKSATTRLYDTEAKIICIVSKKGAQCIECHHKDI